MGVNSVLVTASEVTTPGGGPQGTESTGDAMGATARGRGTQGGMCGKHAPLQGAELTGNREDSFPVTLICSNKLIFFC